jgi:hypothetical protein
MNDQRCSGSALNRYMEAERKLRDETIPFFQGDRVLDSLAKTQVTELFKERDQARLEYEELRRG